MSASAMFMVALAALAVAPPVRAASLPPDLAKAAQGFDAAQMSSDGRALARFLADDYRLVNGDGSVETKAEFIVDYTSNGFHLDPYVVRQPVELVWADGAVLGGVVDYNGVMGGKRFARRLRFADVWARRSGRWQVIYTQVAPAPAPGAKSP